MSAPVSRFLPQDFSTEKSLALIAGQGLYPELILQRAQASGYTVKLIAFEGETADELWRRFDEGSRASVKVGQIGALLKALKRFDVSYAVMAGQITPTRLFKDLHPDLKAITMLARLKRRNAETIFGAIGEEMEKINVPLLDGRVFMDDQLSEKTVMAKGAYVPEQETLSHGIEIAREIARMDIGQGVVVNKGTVLAVEAFEGTDKMLERAGTFDAKAPLFIKTVKPNQDYRFDVPVFGMRTVEKMKEFGIAAAALKAENVLMLEKEKVLAYAQEHKITLMGY